MDYCSTCRRHLNGALVCPGCGAYAPDIAPLADGTPAQAAATGTAAREAPPHVWNGADPAAEGLGEAPQEHPYDGSHAPSLAPLGRAARRRQRERWKKTQRRALVATAVALVGGGMTVSLNRQAPDRTQAASTPDRSDREVMGIAEEEATDPTPVSSPQTDTQRTERASSGARSVTTNVPHEQAAVVPQPRSTPATQTIRQDSVTAPLTAATASTASQAASTVSGATDTVTETTASPTPSATDSTSTSETDTSAATPSPSESSSSSSDASSPSGICLLGLVCIS